MKLRDNWFRRRRTQDGSGPGVTINRMYRAHPKMRTKANGSSPPACAGVPVTPMKFATDGTGRFRMRQKGCQQAFNVVVGGVPCLLEFVG
jgi:hypothetical protein